MASLQDKNNLEKVYLAAFQRAPELSGLNYWLSEVDSKGLAATLKTIFSLPVVQQVYSAAQSNEAFVTAIYNNVFNKTPDADGLKYWADQLKASGNRGQLALDMINAGLSTPDGTSGKTTIVNRFEHAKSAITEQESTGVSLDPTYLANQYKSITSDPASVTQVSALLDAQAKSQVAAYDPAHDAANAAYRNDGVIDLFPSQGTGQNAVLTAAQAEFIANLEIATGLAPLNNESTQDISQASADSSGISYLIFTVLNDKHMTSVRFHLSAAELTQVASVEMSQAAAAEQMAKQSLSADDQALLDRLFNDPAFDENSISVDAAMRIDQAERSTHDYFSNLVLTGYQKAAAGTLDGWITIV